MLYKIKNNRIKGLIFLSQLVPKCASVQDCKNLVNKLKKAIDATLNTTIK